MIVTDMLILSLYIDLISSIQNHVATTMIAFNLIIMYKFYDSLIPQNQRKHRCYVANVTFRFCVKQFASMKIFFHRCLYNEC